MGTSRVWGIGLLGGMLALIGVAPMALFISEFRTVQSSMDGHPAWITILLLAGLAISFSGMLGKAIHCAWGNGSKRDLRPIRVGAIDALVVAAPLLLLLILGIWMPTRLESLIEGAASIVRGTDLGAAGTVGL